MGTLTNRAHEWTKWVADKTRPWRDYTVTWLTPQFYKCSERSLINVILRKALIKWKKKLTLIVIALEYCLKLLTVKGRPKYNYEVFNSSEKNNIYARKLKKLFWYSYVILFLKTHFFNCFRKMTSFQRISNQSIKTYYILYNTESTEKSLDNNQTQSKTIKHRISHLNLGAMQMRAVFLSRIIIKRLRIQLTDKKIKVKCSDTKCFFNNHHTELMMKQL